MKFAYMSGLLLAPFITADSCSELDQDHDYYPDCAATDGSIPCDCDDQNPDKHPGAVEVYDNIDDDCDGVPEWESVADYYAAPFTPILQTAQTGWASVAGNYLAMFGATDTLAYAVKVYMASSQQCILDSVARVGPDLVVVGYTATHTPVFNMDGCAVVLTTDDKKSREYVFDYDEGDNFYDVKVCGDSIYAVGESSDNENTYSRGTIVALNLDLTERWSAVMPGDSNS